MLCGQLLVSKLEKLWFSRLLSLFLQGPLVSPLPLAHPGPRLTPYFFTFLFFPLLLLEIKTRSDVRNAGSLVCIQVRHGLYRWFFSDVLVRPGDWLGLTRWPITALDIDGKR